MRGVIERFDALKDRLVDAAAKGHGKPVSQVRLRPPLLKPENIICMAVNYSQLQIRPDRRGLRASRRCKRAPVAQGADAGSVDLERAAPEVDDPKTERAKSNVGWHCVVWTKNGLSAGTGNGFSVARAFCPTPCATTTPRASAPSCASWPAR
jgi:hypothetical protein